MGRKIPTSENSPIHQAITFSLMASCFAATIAVITALCGARFRRKSSPSPTTSPSLNKSTEKFEPVTPPSISPSPPATSPSPPAAAAITPRSEEDNPTDDHKHEIPELKPPPMHQLRETFSCHYKSNSTHEGGTGAKTFSTSLRFPRSMSVSSAKSRSRKEAERQQQKKDKLLKSESNSIWTKTIILGEKCRVPDEDDDAILYDEKGNRISAYHPRTPSSLPVSRTTSFIDPKAVPS